MTACYGCLEDVSAVIDMCPLFSGSHATCLRFEVYYLFSRQSVLWDQRAVACPLFSQSENSWSEPKSYNKPFVLLHSPAFWL